MSQSSHYICWLNKKYFRVESAGRREQDKIAYAKACLINSIRVTWDFDLGSGRNNGVFACEVVCCFFFDAIKHVLQKIPDLCFFLLYSCANKPTPWVNRRGSQTLDFILTFTSVDRGTIKCH